MGWKIERILMLSGVNVSENLGELHGAHNIFLLFFRVQVLSSSVQ